MSIASRVSSTVGSKVGSSVGVGGGGGYNYRITSQETFDALPELSSGQTLGIARGLSIPGRLVIPDGVEVSDYGSGDVPRLTAFAEITDWTQNGTHAEVYEHNLDISEAITDTSRIALRVDGVFLARAADLAACAAAPGSYYNVNTSIGSDADGFRMVYYHPAGSTDPDTDGKLVEMTVLEECLAGGGNVSITGIEVDGALSNNGPLYVGQNKSTELETPEPQTISRVLVRNGGKHNMLIGSGTLSDSVLHLHDDMTAAEPTNGMLGVYEPNAANLSLEVRNVHLVATESLTTRRAGWSQPMTMHSSDASNYDSFEWYGGSVKGISVGEFGGGLAATVDGLFVDRTKLMLVPPNVGSETSIMRRIMARMDLAASEMSTVQTTNRPASEWHDCCWLCSPITGSPPMFELTGSLDWLLQNCVYISGADGNQKFMGVAGGQTGNTHNVELNGCVIYTRNQEQFSSLDNLTGTRNICIRRDAAIGHVVSSGLDTNTNLLITTGNVGTYLAAVGLTTSGSANTDIINFVGALFLNGLAGVANGDFRLSANADNLQFGDGAFVGDHAVGAQSHWDHNAGASAAGAPSRWPVCPVSLVDARAFVLDPTAWDFYP